MNSKVLGEAEGRDSELCLGKSWKVSSDGAFTLRLNGQEEGYGEGVGKRHAMFENQYIPYPEIHVAWGVHLKMAMSW